MSNSSEDSNAQTQAEEPPKLKIGCAEDLFSSLRSSTLGVRLSVLSKISKAPEKALSYGPYNGRDLLDEIFEQLTAARNNSHRQALLGAVVVFNDARVVDALKTLFRTCHDNKEIAICARRLAMEPEFDLIKFFSRYLEKDARPLQARHTANLLAKVEGHSSNNSVRIAVLCDVPFPTPPFDDDTETAWLEELRGLHAHKAQVLLESLGEAAFSRMRKKWDDFPVELKVWLLGWGGRGHQAMTVELCLKALKEGPDELKLAALQAVAGSGAARELFGSHTTKLLDNPNSRIRLKALQAGAEAPDARAMLERESDMEIRLLLIPQLAKAYGEKAVDDLVRLVEDEDWRVRNVATTALVSLGATAAQAAENILDHERVEVRAAAAQVLSALSD